MTTLTNTRWEQFAQRVASGESATSAYRALYKAAPKSAEAHGCRLVKSGKVSARVAELQAEAAKACVMTLTQRRELLARFAQSEGERTADRIRALELDAKLAGELKGDSVTVNATAVSGRGYVLTEADHARIRAKKQAAIAWERAQREQNNGAS